MKARLQHILRYYWVEIIVIPPFLVSLCYLLYGEVYFASWQNFAAMTFPWLFISILSPIACHWVRNLTLRRFTKLDDWPKRVFWSIFGYMVFTVGLAKFTYFILENLRYANLVPTEKSFYGLLILASMCVLITATLYEGITYFGKWKAALMEAEQLEKLHLESQFQSIQSQLNPHFLFNSLNVLSSLIAENPKRAEDFVDELSNVYRYLLRSNERELATVADELRFIRSFFHLLETRHDAGISLRTQVSSENSDKRLPALALQILVENAVKHNEISPDKPLNIEILNVDDQAAINGPSAQRMLRPGHQLPRIIVRNNLQAKTTRSQSNHIGIDNLRQRYDLLGVTGFEVHNDGAYFTVVLPLVES